MAKRFSGCPSVSVRIANSPPATRSQGGAWTVAVVMYKVLRSASPKVLVVMFCTGISNHPINLSVGRNPDDTASEEPAIPEIALRVVTGAIGQSPTEVLQERPPVPNRTRGGVIVVDQTVFSSVSPK